MTSKADMVAIIEAALFATAEPISRGRLADLFSGSKKDEVEDAVNEVLGRYRGGDGQGVMAEEVAGGIRLVTRPELHGYLRKLFELTGRHRLSMAALETLAIVAYRQPITSPEVQELRGVNPGGVLKTLLERRLVRISGRKMVVGKPFLYATTRDFLIHFGLGSLEDLPPLEEFEELLGRLGEEDGGGASEADDEAEIRGPEPVADPEDLPAEGEEE